MFIPVVVPVQKFWIYEIVTLAATILMTQTAFYLSNHDYYSSTSEEDIRAEVNFAYIYRPLIEIVVWWLALKIARKLVRRRNRRVFANTFYQHGERETESLLIEYIMALAVFTFLIVYKNLMFGSGPGSGSFFNITVSNYMQGESLSSPSFRFIYYNCYWILIILFGRVLISFISMGYGFFSYLLPGILRIGNELQHQRRQWDFFVLCFLLSTIIVVFEIVLANFLIVFIAVPFSMMLNRTDDIPK